MSATPLGGPSLDILASALFFCSAEGQHQLFKFPQSYIVPLKCSVMGVICYVSFSNEYINLSSPRWEGR